MRSPAAALDGAPRTRRLALLADVTPGAAVLAAAAAWTAVKLGWAPLRPEAAN